MTHTTTDAAEARALTIARDMREAFDKLAVSTRYDATDRERWAAARTDTDEIIRLLATAEAASGAGEREAIAREVKRVRFLDRYGNDYRADDERLDHIELEAADRILASLPPATDPAMVLDPTVIELVSEAAKAYEAFEKARAAMNAAIPSLDATPAERALYDERYKADHAAEREHWATAIRLAQAAPAIRAALAAAPTIPATGHAATEGEGARVAARDAYNRTIPWATEEQMWDAVVHAVRNACDPASPATEEQGDGAVSSTR